MADPEDIVELGGRRIVPSRANADAGAVDGPHDGANGAAAPDAGGTGLTGDQGRAFLRVWFACSGLYARAYRNQAGTGYSARCSRCAETMRFTIGPGGTSERFFQVTCGRTAP